MYIDKKNLKIADNYAKALLKAGKELGLCEKLYKDFKEVIEITESSKDLKSFIENPLISSADKKEIIYKVFGKDFDLQIINLLNLLVDGNRTPLIDTVFYCFEKMYENENSILKAEIISAVEINEKNKARLYEVLKKKSGCEIIPEYKTDETILGGLIIKIRDKQIDLSLNSKFKNMEKQLI